MQMAHPLHLPPSISIKGGTSGPATGDNGVRHSMPRSLAAPQPGGGGFPGVIFQGWLEGVGDSSYTAPAARGDEGRPGMTTVRADSFQPFVRVSVTAMRFKADKIRHVFPWAQGALRAATPEGIY